MNLYFLLEDSSGGKRVYRNWLKHCFPKHSEVASIDQVDQNHYLLISGKGYPSYTNRIPASLEDVQKHGRIDHFFICIDTEEASPDEKREEVQADSL